MWYLVNDTVIPPNVKYPAASMWTQCSTRGASAHSLETAGLDGEQSLSQIASFVSFLCLDSFQIFLCGKYSFKKCISVSIEHYFWIPVYWVYSWEWICVCVCNGAVIYEWIYMYYIYNGAVWRIYIYIITILMYLVPHGYFPYPQLQESGDTRYKAMIKILNFSDSALLRTVFTLGSKLLCN